MPGASFALGNVWANNFGVALLGTFPVLAIGHLPHQKLFRRKGMFLVPVRHIDDLARGWKTICTQDQLENKRELEKKISSEGERDL